MRKGERRKTRPDGLLLWFCHLTVIKLYYVRTRMKSLNFTKPSYLALALVRVGR